MTEADLRKIKDIVEWANDYLELALLQHRDCDESCAQKQVSQELHTEACEALDILEREINAR